MLKDILFVTFKASIVGAFGGFIIAFLGVFFLGVPFAALYVIPVIGAILGILIIILMALVDWLVN